METSNTEISWERTRSNDELVGFVATRLSLIDDLDLGVDLA